MEFPISRDPPEGGTTSLLKSKICLFEFPISRDPPEGGTVARIIAKVSWIEVSNF